MAILDIIRMGNPLLARCAAPVEDPESPLISSLVADMVETMVAAPGVGLAAPQVGAGLQVVVFEVPRGRSEDDLAVARTVLINPEIVALGEDVEDGVEGCLSVPGLVGVVPRLLHIGYRGLGLDGRLIEREARGFHARVVQHECDHLLGRLYVSRMRDLSSLAYVDELHRLSRESEEELSE